MSTAKITLVGINQFFINAGSSLFENLRLPTGLDKTVLTNNILLEGGEFEVLYSNPLFLKDMIGVWAEREQATFQRWVDALAIEYAPLENYDRHEDWTDTKDSDATYSATGSSDTDVSNSQSGTSIGDVSAYDSTGYQPKDKTTTSDTLTSSTDTDTSESSTSTLDDTDRHTGRIHGNIGVTTSQQMLQSELDLGYWNIYSRITEMFIKEFCIMIYE